jgi:hypothetical protein
MDLVICPRCGRPAEVEWREREWRPRLQPDPGSVDMTLVKIRCLYRHWFLLPACRIPTIDTNVGANSTAPAPTR